MAAAAHLTAPAVPPLADRAAWQAQVDALRLRERRSQGTGGTRPCALANGHPEIDA